MASGNLPMDLESVSRREHCFRTWESSSDYDSNNDSISDFDEEHRINQPSPEPLENKAVIICERFQEVPKRKKYKVPKCPPVKPNGIPVTAKLMKNKRNNVPLHLKHVEKSLKYTKVSNSTRTKNKKTIDTNVECRLLSSPLCVIPNNQQISNRTNNDKIEDVATTNYILNDNQKISISGSFFYTAVPKNNGTDATSSKILSTYASIQDESNLNTKSASKQKKKSHTKNKQNEEKVIRDSQCPRIKDFSIYSYADFPPLEESRSKKNVTDIVYSTKVRGPTAGVYFNRIVDSPVDVLETDYYAPESISPAPSFCTSNIVNTVPIKNMTGTIHREEVLRKNTTMKDENNLVTKITSKLKDEAHAKNGQNKETVSQNSNNYILSNNESFPAIRISQNANVNSTEVSKCFKKKIEMNNLKKYTDSDCKTDVGSTQIENRASTVVQNYDVMNVSNLTVFSKIVKKENFTENLADNLSSLSLEIVSKQKKRSQRRIRSSPQKKCITRSDECIENCALINSKPLSNISKCLKNPLKYSKEDSKVAEYTEHAKCRMTSKECDSQAENKYQKCLQDDWDDVEYTGLTRRKLEIETAKKEIVNDLNLETMPKKMSKAFLFKKRRKEKELQQCNEQNVENAGLRNNITLCSLSAHNNNINSTETFENVKDVWKVRDCVVTDTTKILNMQIDNNCARILQNEPKNEFPSNIDIVPIMKMSEKENVTESISVWNAHIQETFQIPATRNKQKCTSVNYCNTVLSDEGKRKIVQKNVDQSAAVKYKPEVLVMNEQSAATKVYNKNNPTTITEHKQESTSSNCDKGAMELDVEMKSLLYTEKDRYLNINSSQVKLLQPYITDIATSTKQSTVADNIDTTNTHSQKLILCNETVYINNIVDSKLIIPTENFNVCLNNDSSIKDKHEEFMVLETAHVGTELIMEKELRRKKKIIEKKLKKKKKKQLKQVPADINCKNSQSMGLQTDNFVNLEENVPKVPLILSSITTFGWISIAVAVSAVIIILRHLSAQVIRQRWIRQ